MGTISHKEVSSSTQLLQLLGFSNFERYQNEFTQLLQDDPELMADDWTTEPELLEVFYCQIRITRPHTIIEIGTYKGKTASVMGTALEHNQYGRLLTIDNNQAGMVSEAKKRFSTKNFGDRVTLIENSSQGAFGEWGRELIDFLYIDGSHEYPDTCCDFALWSRFLSHNGVIAVHDTVARLIRRFPEDYLFPLSYYNITNVIGMKNRPSGREWKGCGFVKFASK